MNVKKYTANFIFDILRYLPSKILPMIVSFLWSFIFTRIFSPSSYGIYGLIIALTGPAVTILTEWAAQPIGRFYSEYKVNNNFDVFRLLIKRNRNIILFVSLILMMLCIGIAYFFEKSLIIYIFPAGLAVIFNSIINLYTPVLSASRSASLYTKLQILQNVGRLFIALLLVFEITKSVYYLIWADAISALPIMFLMIKEAKKKIVHNEYRRFKDLTTHYYEFLKYGIPMMLWFLASQLLNVGDRFVINIFLGNREVGIYTANYQIISGVSGILNAPINLAAYPIIMKLWAERKKNEIVKVMKDMTTIFAILSIGIIFGTALLAKDLVIISLGKEFFSGYSLLLPLIIGFVFWQGSMIGHKGLELNGKTITMTILILFAALVNLILNVLFVPLFGIEAAAWVTLISYALYTIQVWFLSKKYIKWAINFKIIIVYCTLGLISFLLTNLFNNTHVFEDLVIRGSIFSLIYSLIVFIFYFKLKFK